MFVIWKGVAKDRPEWWRLISNTCKKIDSERKEGNKKRRRKDIKDRRGTDY